MLYKLFQAAHTEAEFNKLLDLTFTEHERDMMLERWKIFEACDRGLTQRDVAKEVPCSIVTSTRGAKIFRQNKAVIQTFLKRIRQD